MTNEEFSNEFDVLYNNITSNQAPGLNEYEKSVFLTNALNDIIRAYFNPRENKVLLGFDESRKRLMDFSALMKTVTLQEIETSIKFDDRSVAYRIPNDLLLFVNELCKDDKYRYTVLPISYEEYDRLMLKPYLYPIKRGVWRLLTNVENTPTSGKLKLNLEEDYLEETYVIATNSSNKDVTINFLCKRETGPTIEVTPTSVTITCDVGSQLYVKDYYKRYESTFKSIEEYIGVINKTLIISDDASGAFMYETPFTLFLPAASSTVIELIGRVNKKALTYTIRYLRKPRPIIITDLDSSVSILGMSTKSECELDESVHPEILQRAIEQAKAAYTGTLSDLMALGLMSKTDIGTVSLSR